MLALRVDWPLKPTLAFRSRMLKSKSDQPAWIIYIVYLFVYYYYMDRGVVEYADFTGYRERLIKSTLQLLAEIRKIRKNNNRDSRDRLSKCQK